MQPNTTVLARRICTLMCPACGEAKLFASYLKQVGACEACGVVWQQYRADDGPAWLTIVILGHILVPLAVYLAMTTILEAWQIMLGICMVAVVSVLAMLPFVKALFITILWRTRAGAHTTDSETSD